MNLYRLLFIAIVGVYFFSPSLLDTWSNHREYWLEPFVFWGLVVALTAWFERRQNSDEL